MSAQAFGIVRAVRDVDACVTENDDERVVETHPEVAFFVLGGALAKKRSAQGVAQRLRALSDWRGDVLEALGATPDGAPIDDALDALACLWVAQRWARGERRTLGDGERDVRNLPMRIAPAP
jgi:predicted RNase H-like nuclease